jgi:hypothetical protein
VQDFVESELAFKPLNARAIAGTQQLEDVIGRAKAAECFPWRQVNDDRFALPDHPDHAVQRALALAIP